MLKEVDLHAVVDTFNKTCTHPELDIDRLPCVHAIAVAHHANFNLYTLGSCYYTKPYYVLAYEKLYTQLAGKHSGTSLRMLMHW